MLGNKGFRKNYQKILTLRRSSQRRVGKAITEGGELAVKPEEARQVMAVIDAARESSEKGEGVRI